MIREFLHARVAGDSGRIIWAIADQCAVSGGNFCTNLILLRTLLPTEFGTFALFLNAITFFNTIQRASVSYPLCARGARSNASQFRRILTFALFVTALLVLVPLGPALGVVGIYLRRPAVILPALSAMLAWQLQDTLRMGFIARLEQKSALIGDTISYTGQAALLGLLCIRSRPSISVIFWTIAGTSFVALLVQSGQMRPLRPPRRTLRPIAAEFWNLAHWNVVATLVGFLTLQAFPWLILARHGKVEVAGFQAILLFCTFTNPLLFSVGGLITATVAKYGDYRTTSVRNYLLLVIGAVVPYLLLLAFAGPSLMRMLYGPGSHYIVYAPLMRVFAAAWLFETVALLASTILGGLRRPHLLFLVQGSGAAAAVLIALPWTYWAGLLAAGFGLLLVNIVRAAVGVYLVLRQSRPKRGGRSEAWNDAGSSQDHECPQTRVTAAI